MPGVGTTHHLKLGSQYLIVDHGTYRKRMAPPFGARFSSGDPGYDNLSMWQHWVQSCWIGGMGAETWIDDAMYDQGVGVDSTNHEVLVLARDMGKGASGWAVGGDSNRKRKFAIHLGVLYCLNVSGSDDAVLYKYTPSTDTWASFKTWAGKTAGSLCSFDGDLFVGLSGTTISRFDGTTWSSVNKPTGVTDTPRMMYAFRERLYVGFGRKIYRLKPDNTWDGSTFFFDGVGVDAYIDAAYHLGFLYFLSENGHVIRTDGNTTFDQWQWDGHVIATGMASYDGRLFVGTLEFTDTADVGEGVLYQFSGAALTELKRWGRVGRATSPGRFAVAQRRMFYGASDLLGLSTTTTGMGVAVYDSAEDAHSIFASNRDDVTYPDSLGNGKSWQVDDIIYFQGYIICSTRGHGLFKTRLQHRDVSRAVATYDTTAAGAALGSDNAGWMVSSDFDANTPGLQKIWRRITVHVDLPSTDTSVRVSYSLDGGLTYTHAGTVTKTGAATRYATSLYLENVRGTRFKYKLQLDSTDSTKSPQVRGVIVSYLPQPEPTWMWEFTAILADNQELLDGTIDSTTAPNDVFAALEAMARAQNFVYFQDVDQSEWQTGNRAGVLILDLMADKTYIGPASEGDHEGRVRIQIIEAVEAY